MIYWVDIIEDIVDQVRADASKPSGIAADAPYYLHGHPVDIQNQLTMRNKSNTLKYKKWPLIALFQDFDETYGENSLIESEVSLNLIIATNTKPEFFASDRYTETFKTTLYPLYNLFLSKIIASKKFKDLMPSINGVPHTKTDRLYWGTEGGNTANSFTSPNSLAIS